MPAAAPTASAPGLHGIRSESRTAYAAPAADYAPGGQRTLRIRTGCGLDRPVRPADALFFADFRTTGCGDALPSGATPRRPPQFSERLSTLAEPAPHAARKPHLRPHSPETPLSRVSCCCSPPPTPCCSTATWATCARCWAASRATRPPGKRSPRTRAAAATSRFLNIATAIGLLFLGVAAVKYGDTLMPGRLAASIPQGAALIFSLLVSLASLGIAAYQTIAVRLAGALTLSQPFIAQLVLLKRTCFALGHDRHFTPAAALRTLPAGHGRRLVLHHRRRIGRSGRPYTSRRH